MRDFQKSLDPDVFYPRRDIDFSDIEVKISFVSGRGVYASRSFDKGEEVMPLTGFLRYQNDPENEYDSMTMQIGDELWLDGAGYSDDYINHSCTPNMGFSNDGDAYIAIRPIKAGEELFFDYATADLNGEWIQTCRCDSAQCRGKLTSFEKLPPEIQQQLLPNCLPYIRKKYE